jgi:cobalt-zinc-cadmium resistance protein CzcA
MIESIIRSASSKAFVTLLVVLAAAALGTLAFLDLRRDVFPDLSTPTFNVIVQNPAMGVEDLEAAIAIPLESALGGLPGARRIRSTSQLGVVQITVEFEPDADYFRSRQFLSERLQSVTLPPGTEPPLLSSLTGRLNEVLELTLEAEPGVVDLMTLRDLAELDVQTRLLAVPGVAAVERLGGYLRQFQVQLDPERMLARGVSLEEVMHALDGANENASAGLVTRGTLEWGVRAIGRATSVADIGAVVVKLRGPTPVLVSEVADVREAPAVRRGVAHRLNGEIVSCRVVKQFGADTLHVADGVRAALGEIQRGLPPGVSLRVAYDQSELVRASLGGVGRAVLVGAGLVVLVLCLLLGNVRAALLVTLTIPLSVAIAGLLLKLGGVGLNTMTLGGLAIAVGLLVDASIIVVENIVHRSNVPAGVLDRGELAVAAASEVARPVTFATAIVCAVFLPLFAMSGIEGRMYGPLAAAVVASMLAALTLALTFTPVAARG